MTPTRLRQIADRLERVCSNYQELIGAGYKACKGCIEASNELRLLAEEALEKGWAVHSNETAKTPEVLDHQPAGPRDAA